MGEFARRSEHVVIDADGHVCEPVDLWERELPASMRERGPRVRHSDKAGTQQVLVEDHVAIPMGLAGLGNAGMHRNQDFGNALRYPEDLNPGGWDATERLAVMDAEGIDIAVLYCGLGQSLGGFADVDLAVASHQVWNEWIAEWTATDPERLVGTAVIPPHDPQAAAREVHRAYALGLVAGVIRPNPVNGVPLWSPHFDPMYDALAGTGMPLGLHGAGLYDIDGVSKRMIDLMAMGTHHALILFMDQYLTLAGLVYGGVFDRHPELQVLVLECGGGWIAHWMDRFDEFLEAYDWALPAPLSLTPSEYFRRNCVISFDPGERTMGAMADLAGEDNLIWASDFPHSDAKYPGVVDELLEHVEHLPAERQRKILGENAARIYGIRDRYESAPRMPELDLLLLGGTVVDGSGLPGFTADVGVRDGRVVAVGRLQGNDAKRTIDADGCVVAPGFVDIHTHYDAQLHFEPTASPSSWHGVTTVINGNCGFSLFPARPDDVAWLCEMLSRVEGMSAATLAAGVTFAGGGLPEFAAGLDGTLGVNAAFQVGHCALRRHVMRDDAGTRAATAAEIAAMQALLVDALDAGAVGFSSSQLEMHVDQHGQPVPSNLAAPDELVALASVFASRANGVIEFISRSNLEGHDAADRELMLAMCEASGKPMNVNPIVRLPFLGDGWERGLEFVDVARTRGLRVHPQSQLQQMQVFFALHDTFLFDEMPAFREVLTAGDEREALLADPAVRERLRDALGHTEGRAFVFTWDAVKVARADEHAEWLGRTVVDLAREWGSDPLDAFLDASLAEHLTTTFTLGGSLGGKSRETTERVVRHPASIPGSSDAGAHLTSYCGVDFSTRLLTEYVGDAISLEDAVRRLATIPAQMYGFVDRGTVRAGSAADLVVWDPARLGVGPTRWSDDFPVGGGRFVVESTGYRALVVNGALLLDDGADTGARAGAVLRP